MTNSQLGHASVAPHQVPFFRPEITEAEIAEVVATLRSGWLTTGPRVRRFEQQFSEAVGARHAIALNSCTAALHLAVEALGLQPGQAVLVPTMTFAATAEVVRYQGATPILVDCDATTFNLDLADAERKLARITARRTGALPVVGIMPVHVGGLMMNIAALRAFADARGLWVVEDAAHAFPAAWRPHEGETWRRCGEDTASVTCFSFYANKTITTGEGGMAVTGDAALADRIRLMSLHGLSRDAWDRYSGGSTWDYKIVAPGFKYNMTDTAAALGLHQLARAEEMRKRREAIARCYLTELGNVDAIELPARDFNAVHAWHLFPIRLRLDMLRLDRTQLMDSLRAQGVMCSVHWRPLHLHPYYQDTFGLGPDDCPVASSLFPRLVSLPLFSCMTEHDLDYVVETVKRTIWQARR